MADKGDTYYCAWVRESDGTCTGWELCRPTLRANAPSPRKLMGALGRIISREYDDQEAALHFDPLLREVEIDPALFADGLVEIAWNAGFHFRPSALTAYVNGRCPRCGGGIGPRSTQPLKVDDIACATGGASSPQSNEPPPCRGMPGSLTIISREFLGALSEDERGSFEARAVEWESEDKGAFYEMVPRSLVPLGAVRGADLNGWRCGECERRAYSHIQLGIGVGVVCREHLPAGAAHFFFAGSPTDIRLYCTRERWRLLAGTPIARKLTGFPLAVVGESVFDATPPLGKLDEIAEFRREHGFNVPFRPQKVE